ncbi:hypothetical protein ACH5RR_036875 [Cinchona calisaya]|uniref:Uncharacterized protein n=1 Tax=Cinchona calisaya TaxID=153742 RepID=A0ABD2Y5X0_9GENT
METRVQRMYLHLDGSVDVRDPRVLPKVASLVVVEDPDAKSDSKNTIDMLPPDGNLDGSQMGGANSECLHVKLVQYAA